jgi:hypothetical protein
MPALGLIVPFILQAILFSPKSGWFILGFMRLTKVDNQPFINLIKLFVNLVSMHYLCRKSGILGGVSYNGVSINGRMAKWFTNE